jgi:hypothetical protein
MEKSPKRGRCHSEVMNELLGFGKSLQYSDGRYRRADLQKALFKRQNIDHCHILNRLQKENCKNNSTQL